MHQENPELFLWVKISSIKFVTASSIYSRELAIHENQADLYESRSTEKKIYIFTFLSENEIKKNLGKWEKNEDNRRKGIWKELWKM